MGINESSEQNWAQPGVIWQEAGEGGLPRVAIQTPTARAQIYLQGAHVASYQPTGAKPVLFTSAKSLYQNGKAIRGGVPLIFPWFGAKADNPKAPQHGFGRSTAWSVAAASSDGETARVSLKLNSTPTTKISWPYDFEAAFHVRVGKRLEMHLEIRNTGSEPFTYEEALHTYLHVGDVRQCRIEGLNGRLYIDKVDAFSRKLQEGAVVISGETDRVYLDTADTVTVHDPVLKRKLVVSKEGSRSTVVWNPWIEKAKAMSDFGDDEWPQMVCIETANAADNIVSLQPGKSHTLKAIIEIA